MMKSHLLKLVLLIAISFGFHAMTRAQQYLRIHRKAIVIDTHNDILSALQGKQYTFDEDLRGKTYSDLSRMVEGGIDIQVFSVFCGGEQPHPFAWANQEIDTLDAVIARNASKMMLVRTPAELMKAVHRKKLGCMLGVEGGHMIENDLSKLEELYDRGVRYMTLTWNNSNPWATSAMEETYDSLLHQPKGLSAFGKMVVRRMNQLGMLVDLSHVGEQTFWDAIHTSTKPVLVSHSCVYRLCPVFRNLKDDQIRAVARNGGVIDLNFYSDFLDSNYQRRVDSLAALQLTEKDSLRKGGTDSLSISQFLAVQYRSGLQAIRPPLSLLLDHLDYIVKLVGVDYVGLGSDFDGIDTSPKQLDDVTDFPLITRELLKRGYSRAAIYKILGGNFLRVFRAGSRPLPAGS